MLTVKEVSQCLGLDPQTVYTWIRNGKIAAIKPSDCMIRIAETELERFMKGVE
ncbi:helix-turn-helix domain-containing protein [Aneurinibacillus sp. XH2]|uniref:helix-turn-helix domain-containing protein n=1 Tax=Aneurinibacillus sp. XH2 TaxID=1450761 RepID=UPI0009E9DB88